MHTKRVHRAIAVLGVCVAIAYSGCRQTAQGPMQPAPEAMKSIGQLHNEFLELIEAESAIAPDDVARTAAPFAAARRMAAQYDVPALGRDEVQRAIELGVQWAQRDPDALVRDFLSDQEYEWWSGFMLEADPEHVRAGLAKQVRRSGAPQAGSRLATLVDIAVASAEYWSARRGDEPRIYVNPATEPTVSFSVAIDAEAACSGRVNRSTERGSA